MDPNFPSPNGDGDAPIIIYGYTPSTVLCYLAFAFFGLALLGHAVQLFKYRTWSVIEVKSLNIGLNADLFCCAGTSRALLSESSWRSLAMFHDTSLDLRTPTV